MKKISVSIISPTFVEDEKVNVYSKIDRVERAGFVPNDKKIEQFIQSGVVGFDRHGGGEYEIQESESDFEEDSPEFLEELTKQAEDFDELPLAQHMDKLTAEEILSDTEKTMESQKREPKKSKNGDTFEDSVVKAITKGFDVLKTEKNKAESEPKD